MKTALAVCKINVLSLLALPLLLVSVAAKLLQKAAEKLLVFLGAGAAILALSLLNGLFNSPGGFLDGLGTALAFFLLFGVVILLVLGVLFLLGSIAAAAAAFLTTVLMTVLDGVFQLSHDSYCKLYDICRADFEDIRRGGSGQARFACVFWHLLMAVNRVIVTVFSFALPICAVCAALLWGISAFWVHRTVQDSFGIGVWQYLSLFPTANTVFALLYFVILLLACTAVLIALGTEWNEWGNTLKYATQDYAQYKGTMRQRAAALDQAANTEYSFAAGQNQQRCQEAMETLRELMDNLDFLGQQVEAAMQRKQDSAAAYDFAAYVELLNQIVQELNAHNGHIPCGEFARSLLPKILLAKKQAKNLERDVFSILNAQAKHSGQRGEAVDFFAGCETAEEIRSRYKALCKVYHPDAGGHEDTFKQLQNQYEAKLGK